MTSQYRGQTVDRAWVGLSRPAPSSVAPGISVVASDAHYQVTVPLCAFNPRDIQVDLNAGMLSVSVRLGGAPSEDLDDLYSAERTMRATSNIYLGRDVDKGTLSALCLRDTLLISANGRRAAF